MEVEGDTRRPMSGHGGKKDGEMKKLIFTVMVLAVSALALPAHAIDVRPVGQLDWIGQQDMQVGHRADLMLQGDDSDGDGIDNDTDNCPSVPNGRCYPQTEACDIDGDGVLSPAERSAGYQRDVDRDGTGDACDDSDRDGVMDYDDSCPLVPNPADPETGEQDDSACTDRDGDGKSDSIDNCIDQYNPDQDDRDADGVGDPCDNCPYQANVDQIDSNEDGFGDACSEDADGDGVPDRIDNCPTIANPDQENSDRDFYGDACDVDTRPSESGIPSDDEDDGQAERAFGDGGCSLAAGSGAMKGQLLSLCFLLATVAIACDRRRRCS